ncbi:MAG: family 43 glycosylhydrolase [Clostridia bacterium]|nr:family 43 glycosylhydrolase [Clostridia bacterium]
MKKLFSLALILCMLFSVAACNDSSSISKKDMKRPSSTSLEYIDHSAYTDGETHPDFDTAKWYRNDLTEVPLPDPYVFEVDGTYYIYGTTDRTGSACFDCWTTTDFNEYSLLKNVYLVPDECWSKKSGLFAPEMLYYEGEYWLYFSVESKENDRRYIHVVKSDSPTGPFEQVKQENFFGEMVDGMKSPIFRHNDSIGLGVLDQHVFVDDDGSMYMYYSVYATGDSQYIVGFEMYDPITPNWDTYKILVRPGELTPDTKNTKILAWEAYQDFEVAEGPFMLKSPNGKYYLTYSVNHYPDRYYTVCYAVSDSPLGDYTKPYTPEQRKNGETWTNLLFGFAGGMKHSTTHTQWNGFMSGTAHHCFFKSGDQWMIGYHAHRNRDNSDSGRMFGMDYLFFDEQGVPYCEGPTYSIQPLPEAISGYKNIALNATVKAVNVTNPERINDNYIVEHYNLVQNEDKEVTLGAGESYIELVFDKEYNIGGISIYNSAWYEKMLDEISFINFFNDNVIFNLGFCMPYINEDQSFIFPSSAFTAEFNEFKATRVVIGFNTTSGAQLNEIKILGR